MSDIRRYKRYSLGISLSPLLPFSKTNTVKSANSTISRGCLEGRGTGKSKRQSGAGHTQERVLNVLKACLTLGGCWSVLLNTSVLEILLQNLHLCGAKGCLPKDDSLTPVSTTTGDAAFVRVMSLCRDGPQFF